MALLALSIQLTTSVSLAGCLLLWLLIPTPLRKIRYIRLLVCLKRIVEAACHRATLVQPIFRCSFTVQQLCAIQAVQTLVSNDAKGNVSNLEFLVEFSAEVKQELGLKCN